MHLLFILNTIKMCLLTSQRIPFIAEKDLTVFKVLHKDKNNKYFTPYQGMHINFNTLIRIRIEQWMIIVLVSVSIIKVTNIYVLLIKIQNKSCLD